jgi:negative regulator of flagellin synthesis FlgM
MVIDKIGNINNIVEPRKSRNVQHTRESSRDDSVQISTEGKIAADAARQAQVVREAPDVRTERVNQLREQIANGTYNFDDDRIIEKVAERIATFLLRR